MPIAELDSGQRNSIIDQSEISTIEKGALNDSGSDINKCSLPIPLPFENQKRNSLVSKVVRFSDGD